MVFYKYIFLTNNNIKMKVLLINTYIHSKNLNALQKYDIELTQINHANIDSLDLSKFDVVYSPSIPINVAKYPKTGC